MSTKLKTVAQEVLELLDEGSYVSESGRVVSLKDVQNAAVEGTSLVAPEALERLLYPAHATTPGPYTTRYEVTGESTQVAAARLANGAEAGRVMALNFASARNPGGGFLRGAKAQEEDVCRCSGLFPCLVTDVVRGYYDANRSQKSLLYTDTMISAALAVLIGRSPKGDTSQRFQTL